MSEAPPERIDHLVLAVPDLNAGVDWFTEQSGVRPVPGGRYLGRGTANYLVGLGGAAYLEIIGPDPTLADLPRDLPLHVGTVAAPTLVTWAVRVFGMDGAVDRARDRGYDPGDPAEMSRRTADGVLLAWSLTPDTIIATGGLLPFLIDWGTSPHPTTMAGLPQVELVEFSVFSASSAELTRHLAALEVALRVSAAPEPALRAVLGTPAGEFRLGPDSMS